MAAGRPREQVTWRGQGMACAYGGGRIRPWEMVADVRFIHHLKFDVNKRGFHPKDRHCPW